MNDCIPCSSIEKRFGERVRILRIQRSMTQEDLAFLCHVHQHYISDIECGKRNVTLKVVEKIALALRVKEHELFK